MLRVGYPSTLSAELFSDFPAEVEMIAIPENSDATIEIDVWIPDFYPARATRAWPHLNGVRLVLAMLAGTEWIPPLVGPHVTVCSARGAHNIATAEWVVAATLSMLKFFPFYQDVQRSGIWKRRFEASALYEAISGDARPIYPPVLLEELTGKRVLVVGYGSIGKEIERMLEPFRVELTRVARTARTEPTVHAAHELDSLLPDAQIVVLIVPYSEQTRWLIDRPQLGLMGQGTLLVNAARGAVVNTDALVESLQAGRIRAALDVTDPEPLPEGHALWSCPNVLITPHIGAASPEAAPNALRTAAAELRRYMNGEPLENVVQAAI
jgi:phosphoglycerate dehydrogenase-like enzyme